MSEGGGAQYLPTNLRWRIASLMNMSKTKIQIIPQTPSTVKAGQKLQVTLPYSSLLDLSTFTMEFTGETVKAVTGDTDKWNTLRFPRNSFSLIDNLMIKFNNVVVQNLTDYNMIQNILFDISSNTQDADGRMNACMLNIDPSMKAINQQRYIGLGGIAKGSGATAIADDADIVKDKTTYYIKNWLGLLQQGNINVIDTSIVGTIQLTIGFASPAVLGQNYATATTYPSPDYTLSDIKFNVTKINMPTWYYDGLRSQLMNGTTYSMYFPHYNVFTGQSGQSKTQTTRFTLAADSLDYLLGTFINSDYQDTTKLNKFYVADGKTLDEVISKPSSGDTFNQTRYFQRNGNNLLSSQWTLGSEKLPQVPNTLKGCVQSVVEAFNMHQSADAGFYKGMIDIIAYEKYYFQDILSLEHVGDTSGIMLVSGLNTRELPISIEWSTKDVGATYTSGSQYYTPFIIAKETRRVDIGAGNAISIN